MTESVREVLAREALEAELVAEAEDGGAASPQPGQRARRRPVDPSQVYSVRIPIDRIEQLRRLAQERGFAPTALLRQFVIERLDVESAPTVVAELPVRDPRELRLGPSRSQPLAEVSQLVRRRA